jgi:hypothetical protein
VKIGSGTDLDSGHGRRMERGPQLEARVRTTGGGATGTAGAGKVHPSGGGTGGTRSSNILGITSEARWFCWSVDYASDGKPGRGRPLLTSSHVRSAHNGLVQHFF